jgi:alginate O-acetyltransferase complex protein AlgI
MVFSSVSFLFLLLPIVLCCTFLCPTKYRNHIMLAASLLFYFWGEGVFTLLLIGSIVLNFFLAKGLESSKGRKQIFLLIIGVCCNLFPLFVLKYADFFLQSFHVQQKLSFHLPAGISFFTFQAISYLVDVQRKIVPAEQKMLNCGLYISMFPQLIAGPIVRYHDIAKQLVQRTITRGGFASGAERFVFGLSKKVLLADPLGSKADALFALPIAELSTGQAWLGAVCFSLQIYYDFSGYSDMAIGLGKMFGFTLPENFNYPYIARSMRDFWRRWHISLSTWLRDYLYIPLGGNRCGSKRHLFNLLLVFTLCGLWHGAAWTFVVWGLWHGLFLVLERIVPHKVDNWLTRGLGWAYTFLIVMIGWVIFRSSSMEVAYNYLTVMAGFGDGQSGLMTSLIDESKFLTEFLIACILAFPVYGSMAKLSLRWQGVRDNQTWNGMAISASCAVFRMALFVLLFYCTLITIAAQAYHPFLYFQF